MVTGKYLDACAAEDGGLRDVMAAAEFSAPFREGWGRYLLPRPMFIEQERIRAAADDVAGLFDLLAGLPDRLFDGDPRKLCAAIGADERQAALMTRLADRPPRYGRADLYDDGSALRLLEFNVGSELGGVDVSEAGRALLATEAFGAFAAEFGLGHVDTVEAIARQFVAATGKDAPVVASLEAIGGMPKYLALQRSFQESVKRCGVEVLLGEVDEVERRGGRLYLRDRPVDLVLRYFTVGQLCRDPRNDPHVERIVRAHEAGEVVLWTPLTSAMFSYKSCLPLVSDPELRGELSAEEAALVDRILPWTRMLTPDLADLVRAERANMIIKPIGGLGGTGVHAGWDQTDREWAETVAACTGRGHIVQRRVRPRPEPVMDPRTGAIEEWSAVWGVFTVPDGYGGAFCRAMPSGTGSVVNLSGKGARIAPVFHY